MDLGSVFQWKVHCKFGNFRKNFIFVNSVKTHIFDIEIHNKGVIYPYK